MTSGVLTFSTVPASHLGLGKRIAPPKSKILNPDFWDHYDADTLIYDVIWQPQMNRLRLFLPQPLNFEEPLMAARFQVDGIARKPKLTRYQRFATIDLKVTLQPHNLHIATADAGVDIPVNIANAEQYAGRNVIFTMLKDDDITWIIDWITAHQRNHGADAVIIANNGSTAYTSAELCKAINAVPGIEVANVIDVPLVHGPRGGTATQFGLAKFLQTACLNIVRDRLLQRARAVLICDVDELVAEPGGKSIFDATVASVFKYRTFQGYWRFLQQETASPRHADHVVGDPQGKPCPTKYCIVPDSHFGRMCWSVHSLENVNRRIFRPRSTFRFYHCRGINTSWKSQRQGLLDQAGLPDPETQAFMETTFDHGK